MEGLPMSGILMYTDADVLCGRKGEAQKHVGNKTYRALVNLNKPLYASCRTTEKIKISRSIVAAIREQQGRFLEKDGMTNTFYDIGDKKAVEKTSQALREGQAKLKAQMAMSGDFTENLTAEGTRTSLNDGGPRRPSQQKQQQYQPPPAPHELDPYHSRPNHVRSRMMNNEAPANQNEVRWDPAEAPRSRPTMSAKAESNMSLMSDVSSHFRDMLQSDQTRASFDSGFQEALRNLDVPENPYYDGNDEEGYTEMQPPPPRQMLDVRMDSFRRQLMGIASPQNSTMSLVSNIGSVSAAGGSSIPTVRSSPSDAAAAPNPFDVTSDIHVAPRGAEPTVNEFHFKARPKDAVDNLLFVGGLSKLSLMSGVSEATLDQGAIAASGSGGGRRMFHNGSSELTLDSVPRGSNRKLLAHHRGLSTRSAAMSEVSALDYLEENDNEDE